MITSIKEFKDSLNENLLIPRRSKDERNLKLLQNNYRKLNQSEILDCDELLIDYSYDFPATFNTDNIKLKTVYGNVRLVLDHIPKWLQHITINGSFDCYGNYLTSLEHCPTNITGSFNCCSNNLTSLKGCPSISNGEFFCDGNKLTSLKYCPTTINGDFDCNKNKLKTLQYGPKTVNGSFSCSYNKLTSLKGCPIDVNGYFSCAQNLKIFSSNDIRLISRIKGAIFT